MKKPPVADHAQSSREEEAGVKSSCFRPLWSGTAANAVRLCSATAFSWASLASLHNAPSYPYSH